jgi:hypothetical protein
VVVVGKVDFGDLDGEKAENCAISDFVKLGVVLPVDADTINHIIAD